MSQEKNFSICNPTIVKEALEKNRTSNLYPTKDPDVIACEDEIGKMKKEKRQNQQLAHTLCKLKEY